MIHRLVKHFKQYGAKNIEFVRNSIDENPETSIQLGMSFRSLQTILGKALQLFLYKVELIPDICNPVSLM